MDRKFLLPSKGAASIMDNLLNKLPSGIIYLHTFVCMSVPCLESWNFYFPLGIKNPNVPMLGKNPIGLSIADGLFCPLFVEIVVVKYLEYWRVKIVSFHPNSKWCFKNIPKFAIYYLTHMGLKRCGHCLFCSRFWTRTLEVFGDISVTLWCIRVLGCDCVYLTNILLVAFFGRLMRSLWFGWRVLQVVICIYIFEQ